jgi:membrane protein required for colicin V production
MAMGWVDGVLLAVLVLSVAMGVVRGLVFELMSLVGWLVAYVAATWLAPVAAPHLPIGQAGSALNHAAAFAATFIAALLVWAVLSRVLRLLIHATPLSLIDRLLGAVFGGLRGVLLLLALAMVVSMTPLASAQAWQAAVAVPWLTGTLAVLKPLLPSQISQHLPA